MQKKCAILMVQFYTDVYYAPLRARRERNGSMSKYSGYMDKVALFDLSTGELSDYPWSDKDKELYIGGKIMAAKILFDNLTGKEEAFSEENLIVISTGPLTGTGAPSSSRFNISAISPQTGIVASSNCGGNFGYYLKKAGYDALILKGKCSEHSWLEIYNDSFVLHDADREGVWGQRVSESQQAIHDILDRDYGCRAKCGIVTIGPAGENLVVYSGIFSQERAAGRAGLGAVFGWKNLKAIAVGGNHVVSVANAKKNMAWNKKWVKYLQGHPLTGSQLPRLGTAGLVSGMQAKGLLATRNHAQGTNDNFEAVCGETLAENYNVVNKGCLSCPIKCARTVMLDGKCVKGPELETLGLLAGGILNDSMDNVIKWNYELDELGMDTISAASTLAWAMEANEKGLWANGLKFGETDGISALWEDIAYRRGIGDELAEGSKRLSEKYGGKDFAIQSKGLELAAYEPRRAVGQGLGYAVSNRGGCHLNGGYLVVLEGLGLNIDSQTPKAKADLTMLFQDIFEMIAATGQCLFTGYAILPDFLLSDPNGSLSVKVNKMLTQIGPLLRILNKNPEIAFFPIPTFYQDRAMKNAVGMKMSVGKYIRCGERGYTLERYVDSLFGITEKDDSLPARLTDVPQDPADESTKVPLEDMKKDYYAARGWDKNGVPTEKILAKLKIKKGAS